MNEEVLLVRDKLQCIFKEGLEISVLVSLPKRVKMMSTYFVDPDRITE